MKRKTPEDISNNNPHSKESKIAHGGLIEPSLFDKLPRTLLEKIFSWFDFEIRSPLLSKESKVLKEQNSIRRTCKRFLENSEDLYKKKLDELLETNYDKKENDTRTYRQIHFELESKLQNYAMNLCGQIMLWKKWDHTYDGQEYADEHDDYREENESTDCIVYKLIGDYIANFALDVGRVAVLRYLFKSQLRKDLFKFIDVNKVIFSGESAFGMTLLEWMCAIGDLEAVKFLLTKGANINFGHETHCFNPVWLALTGKVKYNRSFLRRNNSDRIQITHELIKAGADIDVDVNYGSIDDGPFYYALINPALTEENIALFLNKYEKYDTETNYSPLEQILSVLIEQKDTLLNNKPYIFENCIKAFDYLREQTSYFFSMENLVEFTGSYDGSYLSAFNYLSQHKSLYGNYPTPNKFYQEIICKDSNYGRNFFKKSNNPLREIFTWLREEKDLLLTNNSYVFRDYIEMLMNSYGSNKDKNNEKRTKWLSECNDDDYYCRAFDYVLSKYERDKHPTANEFYKDVVFQNAENLKVSL